MKAGRLWIPIVAAFVAAPVIADQGAGHVHEESPAGGYGSIEFPVSCTPAAQKQFGRSVAILHSFGYELAEVSFRGTARVLRLEFSGAVYRTLLDCANAQLLEVRRAAG